MRGLVNIGWVLGARFECSFLGHSWPEVTFHDSGLSSRKCLTCDLTEWFAPADTVTTTEGD